MTPDPAGDRIAVVRERYAFLDYLSDTVAEKRSLPEALDTSRSTVDRAIRTLEDHGLVIRTDGGYTATELGRLSAERYRAFVRDERALFETAAPLERHTPALDLPAELVTDGKVTTAPDHSHRLYERVLADLRTADEAELLVGRLADSRPMRLCRSRVAADELTGGAYLSEPVLDRLRGEFPRLGAALDESDRFALREAAVPDAEVYLTAEGTGRTVTVVVGDGDGPAAAFRSTADDAVSWAEGLFSSLGPDSTPANVSPPDGEDGWLSDIDGDDGTVEGFRTIGPGYFDGRTPADPATAWQVGPTLVDTYYGTAFERAGPDGEPAVGGLIAGLGAGESHALLGPPGAGKTTTCRAVAARWVESGRGTALRRAADARGSMASPDLIAEAAREADGHTLVVIEDLDADEAETVLRLGRRLADEAGATLLVEARERTWDGLSRTLTDTRLLDVARSTPEYRLDSLDETTCRRAIEAFETATGASVGIDAGDLYDRVRAGDTGGLYQLSYQLVAHTAEVPWRTDEPTPTGLDADARAAHDALRALDADHGGSFAVEVGLALAALVAAGREPRSAYVHAVAAAGDEGRHRRVEDVLDALDGRLVFARDDGGYGAQHPTWAVRLLEAVLDREGRTAVVAFQRALSGVFRLFDEEDVRATAARWVGNDPEAIVSDLGDADELVEDLYDLSTEHATLVPLFEPTGGTGIDLPAATSEERRLFCVRDRLLGWHANSDAERARSVADELAERARAADVDAETTARFVARSHRTRGELAEDDGDMEGAREEFEASLEHAIDAGDPVGEIAARNSLAWLYLQTGAFDDAADQLSTARGLGDPEEPSVPFATAVYYQGELARRRGDLETAEERLAETVELDRALGNTENIHSTYNALGMVAEGREAFDRAEEYYRRSIELKREAGNRRLLAKTLFNLGDLLVKRGDLAEAETCLDRSRDIAEEYELERFAANLAGGYGRLALERGDLDEAADRYRDQRERYREHDYAQGAATGLARLGDVARERGDADTAVERYMDATRELFEADTPGKAEEILDRTVELLVGADAPDEAAARCETALAWAEEGGFDELRERIEQRRGELTAALSDD